MRKLICDQRDVNWCNANLWADQQWSKHFPHILKPLSLSILKAIEVADVCEVDKHA